MEKIFMNLKNRDITFPDGKVYCFLNSKPVEIPNRCLCLLSEKGVKGDYTVWLMEIENEKDAYFWPYEGDDYDIVRKELMEDFIEHAFDT